MKYSGIAPGEVVFIKEFGSEPMLVVERAKNMVVTSDTPSDNFSITTRHVVENSWLLMDKAGKYYQYPESVLTLRKPAPRGLMAILPKAGEVFFAISIMVFLLAPLLFPFITCFVMKR